MVHFAPRPSRSHRVAPAAMPPSPPMSSSSSSLQQEWTTGGPGQRPASAAVVVVGGGGTAVKTGGGGGLRLFSRLGQYKRRQSEEHKRRVAEKELDTLHQRIDKLLAKMEATDPDSLLDEEEECVVCLGARATMQTFPCQHRVVCRKCFIRTIQVAVAQRSLPLRCVMCRTRILKLRHAAGSASAPAPGSGCKAVSVHMGSPLHSSSSSSSAAPPGGGDGGGDGFIVNDGLGTVGKGKLSGMASLSKVAPCGRNEVKVGGRKQARKSSSVPPSPFVLEPPRVTLVKGTSGPDPCSPVGRTSHVTRRDHSTRSPSPAVTSSVPVTPSAKTASSRGKRDDVIQDPSSLSTKRNSSRQSHRGRAFAFKSFFLRQ